MKKFEPIFFRTGNNYDRNAASEESAIDCSIDSYTKKPLAEELRGGAKQSFKEECDINTIVKRFGIGYEMPTTLRTPHYGDYDSINDYHSAMSAVAEANSTFNALPADLRARFHNEPAEFVDFCLDEKNRKELGDMGLLSREALERAKKAEDERNGIPEGMPTAKLEREPQEPKTAQQGEASPPAPSRKPK